MVLQTVPRISGRIFQNLSTSMIKGGRNKASSFLYRTIGNSGVDSRNIHTSNVFMSDNERKVTTKVMTITNPFKYISLKIKMILMRGYFDEHFNEKEFLSGARQGIVFVSEKLSLGKVKELKDVLTREGTECVYKLLAENKKGSEELRVEESSIMSVTLNDLGFEYGESGRKWAYALVVCYCTGKDSFSRQSSDFNFEILTSQPKIIKYSFCREYTPGTTDGWMVDHIDYNHLHIYRDTD